MRRQPGRKLEFELLEGRLCLSCDVLSSAANTLDISANHGGAHTVEISDNGAGDIELTCDDATATQFHGIRNVRVRTGSRADHVSYEFTGNLTTQRSIEINTRGGNDQVVFERDEALQINAPLRIDVDSGAGHDFVHFEFESGMSVQSATNITVDLGAGSDFALMELSDALAVGDQLNLDINGGIL